MCQDVETFGPGWIMSYRINAKNSQGLAAPLSTQRITSAQRVDNGVLRYLIVSSCTPSYVY